MLGLYNCEWRGQLGSPLSSTSQPPNIWHAATFPHRIWEGVENSSREGWWLGKGTQICESDRGSGCVVDPRCNLHPPNNPNRPRLAQTIQNRPNEPR